MQDPDTAGCAFRHAHHPCQPTRANALLREQSFWRHLLHPYQRVSRPAMGHIIYTNPRGSEAGVPPCPIHRSIRTRRWGSASLQGPTRGRRHRHRGQPFSLRGDFFPVGGDFSLPFGLSPLSEGRRSRSFPATGLPAQPGLRLRALPL